MEILDLIPAQIKLCTQMGNQPGALDKVANPP
jgi:hypothetical protein